MRDRRARRSKTGGRAREERRGGGGEEDAGAGGKDRVLCLQSMFSWVFIFLPSSLLRPKHLSYVEVSLLVQFPSFLRLKEAFAECGKKW